MLFTLSLRHLHPLLHCSCPAQSVTPSEQVWTTVECVKNVFSIKSGMSGHQNISLSPPIDSDDAGQVVWSHFTFQPAISCLGEGCNAVKLQRCFVDNGDDWIFHFWVNRSYICTLKQDLLAVIIPFVHTGQQEISSRYILNESDGGQNQHLSICSPGEEGHEWGEGDAVKEASVWSKVRWTCCCLTKTPGSHDSVRFKPHRDVRHNVLHKVQLTSWEYYHPKYPLRQRSYLTVQQHTLY